MMMMSRAGRRAASRAQFLRVAFCAFCAFCAFARLSSCFADDASDLSDQPRWASTERRADGSTLEFRVDSVSRFIRNERATKYSTSTVFCDDAAFDFAGDNGEIVVYTFRTQKYVLIDPLRRVRTEIDESEVDRFLSRIKTILRERDDAFSAFMTQPSFEVAQKEHEYFFQSKWIDYRVETVAFDDEQIADLYFRFLDAMGKLNVYMNPGVVTPLARIEMNRRFMNDSRFPEKVFAEIYPKGKTIFTKTFQVENESTFARRISVRDRDRINRAAHFYAQFPFVSFKTYFDKTSGK